MAQELIYTSVPRGLRPGTSGYTTVAHTGGLPAALAARLEGLSGYRHLTVGDDPAASGNPVRYAHVVLGGGGTGVHVLSRVADAGLDHTGRSNLLAHHLALDPAELAAAGPAWVCAQSGVFETTWDRNPEVIPRGRPVPSGSAKTRPCKQWAAATGDAGWGGVLAAATDPSAPGYVVYPAGEDVLPLFAEALALLPAEARWRVTFNTYFTGAQAGAEYQWRGVVAGSPEARAALDERRGVILRLDQPMAGSPTGPLVESARTGVVAEPDAPRPRPVEGILEPPRSSPRRRPRAAADAGGYTVSDPHATELPADDIPADVPDDLPPDPRPAAGGGAVRPLLVGLVLGMLVFLMAGILVEFTSQRSLISMVGLAGEDEKDPKAKLEKERDDFRAERDTARSERDTARRERDAARTATNPSDLKERLGLLERAAERHGDAQKAWDLEKAELTKENVLLKGTLAGAVAAAGVKPAPKVSEKNGKQADPPVPPKMPPTPVGPPVLLGVTPTFEGTTVTAKLDGPNPGAAVTDIVLYGLPPRFTEMGEKADREVTWDNLKAKLKAVDKGTVTVTAENAGEYPLLGMAVVVLKSNGHPDAYRQLFVPPVLKKLQPKKTDSPMTSYRYTEDVFKLLPDQDAASKALKKEISTWVGKGNPIELGRTARVQVGVKGDPIDLAPDAATPGGLTHAPKAGTPQVKLVLQPRLKGEERVGYDLVVDLVYEGARPETYPPVTILSAELGRTVEGVPGLRQDFLRIGDAK